MKEIKTSLENLIRAVKESPEYQAFYKSREEIRKYPEKLTLINEFRMRNFKLQNSKEDVDLFEETDRLNQECMEISKDEVIGAYLEAEAAVCRIVQNINWSLIRSLDFEIELKGRSNGEE